MHANSIYIYKNEFPDRRKLHKFYEYIYSIRVVPIMRVNYISMIHISIPMVHAHYIYSAR